MNRPRCPDPGTGPAEAGSPPHTCAQHTDRGELCGIATLNDDPVHSTFRPSARLLMTQSFAGPAQQRGGRCDWPTRSPGIVCHCYPKTVGISPNPRRISCPNQPYSRGPPSSRWWRPAWPARRSSGTTSSSTGSPPPWSFPRCSSRAATRRSGCCWPWAPSRSGSSPARSAGLIFGHYGDILGRKKLLVISLLMMGSATFLIGLLPGYAHDRSAGADPAHPAPADPGLRPGRRMGRRRADRLRVRRPEAARLLGQLAAGRGAARPVAGQRAARAAGAGADRGRVPVLGLADPVPAVGGAGADRAVHPAVHRGVAGVPRRAGAAPQRECRARRRSSAMPIVEVFRKYPREVFTAMGARFAENVSYYIFTVVVVTYLTKNPPDHTASSSFVLNAVLIGAAVHFVTIPIWGALSRPVRPAADLPVRRDRRRRCGRSPSSSWSTPGASR